MHIFRSIWLQCVTRYRLIQVNLVLKSFSSQILQRNSCFPLDKEVQCCNGALRNLENQHKLYNIANIHTGEMQNIYKTTNVQRKKTTGQLQLIFCVFYFILFYCSFLSFFCTVNGVVSLYLYNCI